ncbi:MAG: hypothetical protein ACI4RL_00695, partial [Ruminococcus sp.]
MKNTLRLSGNSYYVKVFLSIVLVVAMITSSIPIAYAETNTVNALQNYDFEDGTTSWNITSGDITVKSDGEGDTATNALQLTDGGNAVYQAVTKEDGTDFIQGSTFNWELNYKSTASSDIVALVLGLNEPTGNSDQLKQMMTWLRDKRKIDKKVPSNGQYTVIVYSKPFKSDGTFDDGKFGAGKVDFSLTPTMYCTEKFSVTLFRTTGADWVTATNPTNTPYTLNKNSASIYYSLISYGGSPLVDDVSFLVEKTGTEVTEYNNLQNGSFENPTIPTGKVYDQPTSVPYWSTTATDKKIEYFTGNSNYHFQYGEKYLVDNGNQAAELNAEQSSTLYQYIKTEAGSQYKWNLSHRGRYGADIMALVIGPKQKYDPKKKDNQKLVYDQFMQMVDWVKENRDYYPDVKNEITEIEETQANNERTSVDYRCDPVKVTVYSKPFDNNGGFESDNETYFSATETTDFSQKWEVTIICSGDYSWQTYGENDDDMYSYYDVPEGQDDSIFAFTAFKATNSKADETSSKINTYGNLLDGINFDLYYPASSISFTGGDAVLTYVYKDELSTSELKSGEPAKSIMVDENSTFTLDVTPRYSTTTDENGNEVLRKDAEGNLIQNTFLGAYITIGGVRKYYPATAINATDNAVYFSETVDEETGLITYSYGQSNVSGRVVVELVYSEVYTIIYNSKGGKEYSVHSGSYTPENAMDWSGSNENVARFYEKASCTYTSTACQWWEDNPAVIFKGWELVGGTVKRLSDGATVPEDEQVLFKGNATVNYTAPTLTDEEKEGLTEEEIEELFLEKARDVDFIISDGVYEGRVNAYGGGVLVANWEYKTSVIAQTEQLDGSFIDSGVGGQVSLTDHTTAITDSEGTVYSTDEGISNCDKFTYLSQFNNVITVSNQENAGYTFLGWYDQDGNKLSSTTDHSYTVEPYYSTSDKTKETQTPSVIYARFGFSCKVKFHINDMDTVSTVGNPDADLYRVYYPSSVDVSGANASYKILNLDSNNRISYFYDIPTPVSTNGKIFKGWYLDKDNNADNNPIKWDSDTYTTDVDIYAHWINVGTVNKDADDQKIIDKSTVASGLLPGIDLLGVQIRYEDEDENYPNGRGSGSGQALHFDTDGLRFITCIKEDILSQTNSLFKTAYGSYKKQSLRYGYVLAKETTANANLNNGECLEYKDTNVNGVDTTSKYSFVQNVDCTSSVGGYNTSTTILDHRNFSEYRIYSLVVTYNTAGKTDAQIESAKNQNVVARPYLR